MSDCNSDFGIVYDADTHYKNIDDVTLGNIARGCITEIEHVKRIARWDKTEYLVTLDNGEQRVWDFCFSDSSYPRIKKEDYNNSESWRRQFSFNLSHYMAMKGYTPEILSELAGVSQATISRYLNMRCEPSGFIVWKLAEALNVSVNALTGYR